MNGALLRPNVNVPFRLPWFSVERAGVLVLRAELDVVIAVLVRQEPRQRLLRLDAVVDARLRGVVLLIGEGLERQRRLGTATGRGRCC